ncbi:MAG TPA: GNAT family N-acetyltransferase [Bacteroidia bacterium]|nr:GNAT family N-acetyltransferase [Bacteroidia bacterium]
MEGRTIIRKVKVEDNLPLAKMIREVFEEHNAPKNGTVYSDPTTNNLYKLFQIPDAILFVAETDNVIEGCCGIYPTEGLEEGYAELVKFYLSKNARGKGIGKELFERSIHSAIEFGYKKLYLESLPQFSKAVNMYEKQGFKKINQPLGKSGHTTCNIWMLKEL